VSILLENSAGSGNMLGARFSQIGDLLDRLNRDPRLGMCLDTAHAFASGYELRHETGLVEMLEDIDRNVGLGRLHIIHANDSKAGLGSAVDRHENIGRGLLGEQAFRRMLAHPRLAHLPWVLEVPGFDNKGPDAPNVQALKRLAGRRSP
jgi:deoxyribonuclease-4